MVVEEPSHGSQPWEQASLEALWGLERGRARPRAAGGSREQMAWWPDRLGLLLPFATFQLSDLGQVLSEPWSPCYKMGMGEGRDA